MNLFYFLIVEGAMPSAEDRAKLDDLLIDRPSRRRDVGTLAALGGDIR